MNALEAVKMTEDQTPTVDETETLTSPVHRDFLKMALDNCSQEHAIFMTRFNGLRDLLGSENVTDEQIRQANAKLKRSMTDFRTSLKSIPSKL
jgi:predicted DNA-binding ArsR family transcriptional regulator